MDSKTILSAAHCFYGNRKKGGSRQQWANQHRFTVRAGVMDKEDLSGQVHTSLKSKLVIIFVPSKLITFLETFGLRYPQVLISGRCAIIVRKRNPKLQIDIFFS